MNSIVEQAARSLDRDQPDDEGCVALIEESIGLIKSSHVADLWRVISSDAAVRLLVTHCERVVRATLHALNSALCFIQLYQQRAGNTPDDVTSLTAAHNMIALLDELVVLLARADDPVTVSVTVDTLLNLLSVQCGVLHVFRERYSVAGMRPLLHRLRARTLNGRLTCLADLLLSGDVAAMRQRHRHRSAVIIQAAYRGHAARLTMARLKRAIVCIQTRWRWRLAEEERRYRRERREKQRRFSQLLHEARTHKQRSELLYHRLHQLTHTEAVCYVSSRRHSAAVVLQSWWRAQLMRLRPRHNEDWRLDSAATVVQRWWRRLRVTSRNYNSGSAVKTTASKQRCYQQIIHNGLAMACVLSPASEHVDTTESQNKYRAWMQRETERDQREHRCRQLVLHVLPAVDGEQDDDDDDDESITALSHQLDMFHA